VEGAQTTGDLGTGAGQPGVPLVGEIHMTSTAVQQPTQPTQPMTLRQLDGGRETDRIHALETEVEQLRTAMASRAVIEQAKGVLMVLCGCGAQSAFDLLTHISSHTHRKVRDVAADVVASASGRRSLPADVREIVRDACPPAHPA
jgi:ANTAR domain